MRKLMLATSLLLAFVATEVIAQSCPLLTPEQEECYDDCHDEYKAGTDACQKVYPGTSSGQRYARERCYASYADSLAKCQTDCRRS